MLAQCLSKSSFFAGSRISGSDLWSIHFLTFTKSMFLRWWCRIRHCRKWSTNLIRGSEFHNSSQLLSGLHMFFPGFLCPYPWSIVSALTHVNNMRVFFRGFMYTIKPFPFHLFSWTHLSVKDLFKITLYYLFYQVCFSVKFLVSVWALISLLSLWDLQYKKKVQGFERSHDQITKYSGSAVPLSEPAVILHAKNIEK